MRYIKRLLLILLVVIFASIFISCSGVKEFFKKDYEYSSNGLKEIEAIFSQINKDDFNGKVSYVFEQKGKSLCYIDYYNRPQTSQQSQTEYIKYHYNIEDFGFYNDYETAYYIDYEKKFLSTDSVKISKGLDAISKVKTYGRVFLKTDGELAYNFINKKESIIQDYKKKDVETVEFIYSEIKEQDSNEQITIRFNFHKKQKELVRYNYEIYSEENDKTTIIKVYITDIDKNIDTSVFELPREDEGFSVLNEEE